MRRPAYELILSLIACVALAIVYGFLARHGPPRPGGWLGHSLGIVGFLLMLCTELLYTLRKRLRRFTRGRMSLWLQIHVFTGIVGPFLVVLHSAGKFHGLAGLVTVLTVVIVISGFVGRFIYTAIPRTVEGSELSARDLQEQIGLDDRQLQKLGLRSIGRDALALAAESPPRGLILVIGQGWLRWRQRRRLHNVLQKLWDADPPRAEKFENLLLDRYRLLMAINSLAITRRLLSVWHLSHVPLGIVLFTLAFMHVFGALYYATLLK